MCMVRLAGLFFIYFLPFLLCHIHKIRSHPLCASLQPSGSTLNSFLQRHYQKPQCPGQRHHDVSLYYDITGFSPSRRGAGGSTAHSGSRSDCLAHYAPAVWGKYPLGTTIVITPSFLSREIFLSQRRRISKILCDLCPGIHDQDSHLSSSMWTCAPSSKEMFSQSHLLLHSS